MTSHAKQTAADWQALREMRDWKDTNPPLFPDLQPAKLSVDVQTLTEPAAVEAALAAFKPKAGWVERQSRTACFDAGELPPPQGGFDAIVSAELAGEGESLSVRLVANGWRLTTLSETANDDREWLMHDTTLAGVERLPASGTVFGRTLKYRVYWKYDPEQGWRQSAARLLGFGEEAK